MKITLANLKRIQNAHLNETRKQIELRTNPNSKASIAYAKTKPANIKGTIWGEWE
jgi:hypothetical protein